MRITNDFQTADKDYILDYILCSMPMGCRFTIYCLIMDIQYSTDFWISKN